MEKTSFRGERPDRKQFFVLLVAGSLIASVLIFLVARVVNITDEERTWHFIADGGLWNYVILIVAGILLSFIHFYREFRLYDKERLTLDKAGETLTFKDDVTYKRDSLREVRFSPVFYGWFGLSKVIFRFRIKAGEKPRTRLLLIPKEAAEKLAEALRQTAKKETDAD